MIIKGWQLNSMRKMFSTTTKSSWRNLKLKMIIKGSSNFRGSNFLIKFSIWLKIVTYRWLRFQSDWRLVIQNFFGLSRWKSQILKLLSAIAFQDQDSKNFINGFAIASTESFQRQPSLWHWMISNRFLLRKAKSISQSKWSIDILRVILMCLTESWDQWACCTTVPMQDYRDSMLQLNLSDSCIPRSKSLM